jgi:hypothetical protein
MRQRRARNPHDLGDHRESPRFFLSDGGAGAANAYAAKLDELAQSQISHAFNEALLDARTPRPGKHTPPTAETSSTS